LTAPSNAKTVGTGPIKGRAAGPIESSIVMPTEDAVEHIDIVEDMHRDVVEVEIAGPDAESAPQQLDDPEARESSSMAELVPARPSGVNGAGALADLHAVLTISLEPEWPGNVHVYEISIDVRDGTFNGFAARSSNVPGETICGIFGSGFADIDFTAAYPTPGYHYAWFGSGPLRNFMATDSHGNVLHTASATVTNLVQLSDELPDDRPTPPLPIVSAVETDDDELPTADSSIEKAAAAPLDDEVADEVAEVADEAPVDIEMITDEENAVAFAVAEAEVPETMSEQHIHDELADVAIAEPSIEVPVASDEVPELEVVAAVAPEPSVAVETPADDIHDAGCRCLACQSTAFEAVPVTEGPLAGKAFYFRARSKTSAT
jgi:hypothetical protein